MNIKRGYLALAIDVLRSNINARKKAGMSAIGTNRQWLVVAGARRLLPFVRPKRLTRVIQ